MGFPLYSWRSPGRNMGVFKFDLHVHSWHSPDAADRPEVLIEAARERGLDGIAITDHDSCEVHSYCRSAGLSNAEGSAVRGFLVVPGVEVSTGDGHLLCIGTELRDMAGWPAIEVCEAIEAAGGIAIPAHPYDHWRSGIPEKTLDTLPLRALEAFNSAVSSRKFNDRAAAYAAKRALTPTSNSDAHHASAVGVSHTAFEMRDLTVTALMEALRTGRAHPEGVYLSRAEALKKHFGNFFRGSNQRPEDSDEVRGEE